MWTLYIYLAILVSILNETRGQFQSDGCLPGDYPFPASDSCTSFYRCYNRQIFILRCPPAQNFDFARRQCRPQAEVDCTQQLRLFTPVPSPDGNPGPIVNVFRGLNQVSIPPNPLNRFGQGGFNRFPNNGFGAGRGFGQQPGNNQFPQQFPGNTQGFQGTQNRRPGGTNQFPGNNGFGFGNGASQSGIGGSQQSIVPGQSVLSGNNQNTQG
ncbi:hypothetical protein LOTGIDRAFT_153802 [Lottia gigantea]|uniref:Chitin-binding type-2 domain-containing protein n=1 Tax=Lottia gigantea TaxID=225164 RepID=V4ADI3_LOTGI|nr:hypothetical protein LOTGIDRAFT_153802 [Lottia gigantea]ESO91366.1 hypothetical protein LOTGIDRAFT_153802 [Lottia gigantea]